jgi:hypothetical protein
MRRAADTLWSTGLVVALAVSASGSARAEDSRRDRLNRGETIVETQPMAGSDLPAATATAVIEAPPERVWSIINNCSEYSHTMYRIKESRELSRDGDTVRCATTFNAPWPLPDLSAITVAHHTVGPDHWMREWKLESGDYKENSGHWLLTSWAPGRTLVEYQVRSQPRVPVPSMLQKVALQTALPALIEKLRSDLK